MAFSFGYEDRNYHSGIEAANRKLCRRHQRFLQDLTVRQVQDVIGPEKRASVAVVIRLRPSSVASPPYSSDDSETRCTSLHCRSSRKEPYGKCHAGDIQDVFEQQWVEDSTAEILFIKRSSRAGDRWTGHVALPGGRRDKSDEGDEVTAVRECMEEVGLDLTSEDCLLCGALPQRVIITNWGQKPLMVLCPYVFLWTKEEVPEFKLEAAEVAAAFWIPIHFLLDDKHKTGHPVDVSDRMASSTFQPLRPFFKILLGPMYFSAVQLKPSEVSHCAASTTARGGAISTDKGQAMGDLMLWGITYAILADILDFLPPFNFVESFQYPSFGGWDFRSLVWMLSRGYRRGRKEDLMEYKFSDVIGMRTISGVQKFHDARGARISIIDHLIKGYYGFVRKAAYATITFRLVAFGAIVQYLIRTN
ncbi:hypothetical protein TWF788_009333 [Orbilia oligospora]|uniref:Nudix hydrolase domain-containing protein n=1 Tax=Orbilia oligospora TaxID=2813651 RepID=A0A7C8KLH4_ORBOL|nr:hypothetical protein TWF788_009333 [Orbilia oligospora]